MKTVERSFLVVVVTSVMAIAAGAQPPAPLCGKTVVGLQVAFGGFDNLSRATLEITVELAPHAKCDPGDSLLVRIRDGCNPPPYCPTAPEASWAYSGECASPVTVKIRLPVPAYYRGPLFVDALMQRPVRMGPILGPIMLPVKGLGLTPYGAVDLDRNRLHLHAEFGSIPVFPPPVLFRVEGAPPGAAGLIAVSPHRTAIELSPGGRLLIGPAPLVLLPLALVANQHGRFEGWFQLPSDPRLEGVTFYAQAASSAPECGPVPWIFSNGMRVDL